MLKIEHAYERDKKNTHKSNVESSSLCECCTNIILQQTLQFHQMNSISSKYFVKSDENNEHRNALRTSNKNNLIKNISTGFFSLSYALLCFQCRVLLNSRN